MTRIRSYTGVIYQLPGIERSTPFLVLIPPMLNITDVPADLWHIILPLACTDGGFTGTSFAHTCTTLYARALPSRFYSLALSSLAHMEGFLDLLRRQPNDFRPHIAHLYISHSDQPRRRFQHSWSSMSQMTGAQRGQYRRMAEEAKADWNARFRVAFDAILSLAAPSLRTLWVAGDCAPVILYTLPKLEELTWMGATLLPDAAGLPHSPIDSGMSTRPGTSTVPALKRVHFIPGTSSEIPPALRSLQAAANTLTHLRISDVHDSTVSEGVPLALAEALAPDARLYDEDNYEEYDDDSFDNSYNGEASNTDNVTDEDAWVQQTTPLRPATLPNLEQVLVLCTPSELGRHIVFADVRPRYLELLAQEFERRGEAMRHMHVFYDRKRPEDRELYWRKRLKAEWLDRLDAGRACWIYHDEGIE
ncbi:hypothetical protein GY45DRAFT_1370143 [Cubamyces sp. BRFM 1775]|nr:hypothetical protein GY45DRAFT_1370143 [Cubamyces sp. BRFM 1775]